MLKAIKPNNLNLLKLERQSLEFYNNENLYENNSLRIKIEATVSENFNNPNLNGDYISQKMGMSRMQLHRKLKAVTGLNARQFILETRLRKAHELLLTRKWNVSEVTFKIGFSTLPYFSKVFKLKYGISPSTLLKKKVP